MLISHSLSLILCSWRQSETPCLQGKVLVRTVTFWRCLTASGGFCHGFGLQFLPFPSSHKKMLIALLFCHLIHNWRVRISSVKFVRFGGSLGLTICWRDWWQLGHMLSLHNRWSWTSSTQRHVFRKLFVGCADHIWGTNEQHIWSTGSMLDSSIFSVTTHTELSSTEFSTKRVRQHHMDYPRSVANTNRPLWSRNGGSSE